MQTLSAYGVRHTTGFIDLHQDMLSGVAKLDGSFPAYGSNYLTGSHRAAAIFSSLYPHSSGSSLLSQLDDHRTLLSSHSASLRLVTTVDDLNSVDERTGVLPHSEGLPLPAIEPEALALLWAEHSLRSLSLTWNYETNYGFSCYDDAALPLKTAGRQLLGALDESHLLLDLAHLNDGGFFDVLERYSSPVLVTHSFCRAIVNHPRGLSDDQMRVVGEHGGLIGLAFDPDFLGRGSVDEALSHIDRIVSLAGENSISIGSDWGVAAMGELGDHAALGALVNAVSETYGPALAEKFAFENAYEFLRAQLPVA